MRGVRTDRVDGMKAAVGRVARYEGVVNDSVIDCALGGLAVATVS